MDTTETPEDDLPTAQGSGESSPRAAAAGGSGGTGDDDFGYGAGYGYGPGYGDPGDSGYGYGYGAPTHPEEHAAAGSMAGPAVSTPQPVVGPTPALRGFPGGLGIEPAVADRGTRQVAKGHKLAGGSTWQRAQKVWSDSGIVWQRPVADWEPAEAEWERIQAEWTPPQRRRGPGRRGPRGPEQRRPGAGGGISGRVIVTSAAVVALIALVTTVAFIASGGSGPAPEPQRPPAPYPPAHLADADFTTSASLATRGIFQSLDAVASYGATVVAAGSQMGTNVARTQFFVSTDGGRSWQLAPVTAPGGSAELTWEAPTMITAGPAGWLALGPGVSWTSKTGRSWQVSPAQGIKPMLPGDRVQAVTATASGFLAAGSASQRGNTSPVVWTSTDGVRWQRAGASQLGLAAAGVGGIVLAAAHGADTVVAAQVSKTVVSGRRTLHVTEAGLWQSPDGGRTWTRVPVPVSNGAANSVGGLAPSGAGFVVVRPAISAAAVVVYSSTTGTSWSYAGSIALGKQAPGRLIAVSGSDRGAVIALAGRGGNVLCYRSASGRSWLQTATLISTAAASLASLTVTVGGNVVAAGTAGVRGFLAVAGAGRVLVDLTKIRGTSFTQRSINAIAAGPRLDVAVGGANGDPAVWAAPRGQPWSPAVGVSPGVFSRQGLAALTAVTRGPDGWLAVGGSLTSAGAHPVVVFSRDGGTWQAADGGQPFAGVDASAAGSTYGARGYVIVGSSRSGGRTVAAVWHAPALFQAKPKATPNRKVRQPPLWTAGGDAGKGDLDGLDASRSMSAVTAGPFGYVAVGQHGSRPAIWTSADGRTWRLRDLPAAGGGAPAGLRYVTASGGTVVAVGAVQASGAPAPLAAFSADGGKTWQEVGMSAPGGLHELTGLTTAGGGFVAVGTVGSPGDLDVAVLTSPDAAAWKAVVPSGTGLSGPGVQEITALTTADGKLLGAGFTATATTEDATLWLAPPAPATARAPAASHRAG